MWLTGCNLVTGNDQTMSSTIILSQQEVAHLLAIDECIDAITEAFRMLAEGKADTPKILGLHLPSGGLHIKAGMMQLNNHYIVAKLNSNFPGNPAKHKLPTIQGVVAVFNAENGMLLSLMDSIELTIIRTGAATGVAARHLSRHDARSMAICGCGNQGLISFKAVACVRQVKEVYLYDIAPAQAQRLASQIANIAADVEVVCCTSVREASINSDIIITCTPSKVPILTLQDVRPGTFIAAVGTDSDHKNEIDAELIARSKVITDITDQSATIGDLHHAIAKGLVTRSHVHAELGEVIAGKKTGRESVNEIIVFDSTGIALQDVAAASIVYEKALATRMGTPFNFSTVL